MPGLLWDPIGSHVGKVGVHLLMGGADQGGDWNLLSQGMRRPHRHARHAAIPCSEPRICDGPSALAA